MDVGLEEVAQKQVDVEFMSTIAQKMAVPRHIRMGQNETSVPNYHPSETLESMNVPERILVADPFPSADLSGDNEFRDDRMPLHDVLFDNQNLAHVRNLPVTLQTPPSTLTVQNGIYRTAADELEERHNPNRTARKLYVSEFGESGPEGIGSVPATVAGSYNVEQKVMLLEKQMTRLNTRLYQLEDELESVQYWQKITMYIGISLTIVFVLKNVLNR